MLVPERDEFNSPGLRSLQPWVSNRPQRFNPERVVSNVFPIFGEVRNVESALRLLRFRIQSAAVGGALQEGQSKERTPKRLPQNLPAV